MEKYGPHNIIEQNAQPHNILQIITLLNKTIHFHVALHHTHHTLILSAVLLLLY